MCAAEQQTWQGMLCSHVKRGHRLQTLRPCLPRHAKSEGLALARSAAQDPRRMAQVRYVGFQLSPKMSCCSTCRLAPMRLIVCFNSTCIIVACAASAGQQAKPARPATRAAPQGVVLPPPPPPRRPAEQVLYIIRMQAPRLDCDMCCRTYSSAMTDHTYAAGHDPTWCTLIC